MSTNFPTALDALSNPLPTDGLTGHASQHANENDAIEALQAKVGIDGSAVATSLDYKVAALESSREQTANKGSAGGYAGLDGSGKVPAAQLPSYVDDVVEVATFAALPVTGETGKIYVVIADETHSDATTQYRWSGSAYAIITSSPGSTDAVPEGVTNLYFTVQRVRDAVLTGLSTATNAVIAAADSVLVALGKLQAQITAVKTGPAFSAYLSADQSISSGVSTKILFNVEDFDTASSYASSRFAPNVPGYYQINTSVGLVTASGFAAAFAAIWKNGAEYKRVTQINDSLSGGFIQASGGSVIYLNGTDYVEIYANVTGVSPYIFGGSAISHMSGSLIRPD